MYNSYNSTHALSLFSRNVCALLAGCPRDIKSVLNLIVEILMASILGLPPETPDTQANILMDIHVIVNWQLSNRVSTDQCHMTVLPGQVYNSLQWRVFFKVIQLLALIAGSGP